MGSEMDEGTYAEAFGLVDLGEHERVKAELEALRARVEIESASSECFKRFAEEWKSRAEAAEARVEKAESLGLCALVYAGVMAMEYRDTVGIAMAHGYAGRPEHADLGNRIRERLGLTHDDVIEIGRKAAAPSPPPTEPYPDT